MFSATRPTFPAPSSSPILPVSAAVPPRPPEPSTFHPHNQPKHSFCFLNKKQQEKHYTLAGCHPLPRLFLSRCSLPRRRGSRSGRSVPGAEIRPSLECFISCLDVVGSRRILWRDVLRAQSRTCCVILVGGPCNLLTTQAASHADKE